MNDLKNLKRIFFIGKCVWRSKINEESGMSVTSAGDFCGVSLRSSPRISPVINLRVKNGPRVCCCMQISRLPPAWLAGRRAARGRRAEADWPVIYGAPSVNRVMHGDSRMKLTRRRNRTYFLLYGESEWVEGRRSSRPPVRYSLPVCHISTVAVHCDERSNGLTAVHARRWLGKL